MASDPRAIIGKGKMGSFQIFAIILTVCLNGLDGFDVVSISFSAPGIAAEWGVAQGTLGIVLSMGLLGMALGSIFIAPLADMIGRRPMILLCLLTMGAGMGLSATASDVTTLSLWKILTGLGIGAMLASINAVAAEFSSDKRRDFAVAAMAVGYPIGVVIGGSFAAWLLNHFDWRSVFVFGAIVTILFIPLILWRLPESISYLVQRRPADALERINLILGRMGHPTIDALPPAEAKENRGGPIDIFRRPLLPVTLVLTIVYFLHILTFYYMQTWLPKIIVDMGYSQSQGTEVRRLGKFWRGGRRRRTGRTLALRYGLKPLTVLVGLATGNPGCAVRPFARRPQRDQSRRVRRRFLLERGDHRLLRARRARLPDPRASDRYAAS